MLKVVLTFIFLVLQLSVAQASCLIQDNLELYDARLNTREAWAHCSLQDARLFEHFFETTLNGYKRIETFTTTSEEHKALFRIRAAQALVNHQVMRKTLLPVSEGGEARRALINIQSDYQDIATGKEFSLSGYGTLIAQVSRLPNNRITPLNSKTRYFILTAAHLVQGENLRAVDNVGTALSIGRTYFDDEADLAVIELSADPLIQPLAYLSPSAGSQKLATYLEDVNFSSQETVDRFSGFSYPVTPTSGASNAYRPPGFFLGRFSRTKESDTFYSFPLLTRNNDGSVSINRSIKAGLSGTPLFADVGSRYLSLTGVVTYSGSQNAEATFAGPERILKLLLKASRNQRADSQSRWLFVNGLPVHQSPGETKIFFEEKPIGNGIYVNGRPNSDVRPGTKLEPKVKLKLDLQIKPLKEILVAPDQNAGPLNAPDTNKTWNADSLIQRLRLEGVNATRQ